MRKFLLAFLVLVMAIMMVSAKEVSAAACGELDHSHTDWTALLQKHVSPGGLVDYEAMQADRKELKAYLSHLAGACLEQYEVWSDKRRLAYWVNAYNAFTVELILRHYPLESIRSIGWLPNAAFRKAFIPITFRTGERLSLDDIEHQILRKDFDEARIHFAVNCASMSCPPLLNEAYTAARLDDQFEAVTRAFLQDEQKNRYNSEEKTLYLSKIFDWFAEDFQEQRGSVLNFVKAYSPEKRAAVFDNDEIQVEYLDYDWSLNKQP